MLVDREVHGRQDRRCARLLKTAKLKYPQAAIEDLDSRSTITRNGDAMLVQARKTELRLFGTVDSAMKVLHKVGVRRIVLDRLERWHPEQAAPGRRTRPDRAAALPRAAEYDRWVHAKVQTSRDDPRSPVTDEEWQRVRAAKLVERKAAQAT